MKITCYYSYFKSLVIVFSAMILLACGGGNSNSTEANSANQTDALVATNSESSSVEEFASGNADLLDIKNPIDRNDATLQDQNLITQLTPEEVNALKTIDVVANSSSVQKTISLATSRQSNKLAATSSSSSKKFPNQELVDQIIIKYKNQPVAISTKIAQAAANWLPEQSIKTTSLSMGVNQVASKYQLNLAFQNSTHNNGLVFSLGKQLTTSDVSLIASKMKAADPNIEYVAADSRVYPSSTPNDTYFENQWSLKSASNYGIDVENQWDSDGKGVIVAVLDTGYRPHVDLAKKILPGYDFISNKKLSNDKNGRDANAIDPGDGYSNSWCGNFAEVPSETNNSWHGTRMMGIIAATRNNALGIAGIAPGVKILPVRVLGQCGGYSSDIADAIVWASGGSVAGVPKNKTPAKIINISASGISTSGICNPIFETAIKKAKANGSIVVVSAGNSMNAKYSSPGNCSDAITVAAAKPDGSHLDVIKGADIYAPGFEIISTINSGLTDVGTDDEYSVSSGSSEAVAHISGLLALMFSHRPTLTNSVAEKLVTTQVKPRTNCGEDCLIGFINSAAIYSRLNSTAFRASSDFIGGVTGNGKSGILLNQTINGNSTLTMGFLGKNAINLPFTKVGYTNEYDFWPADFNADGKSDILTIKSGLIDSYYQVQSSLIGGLGGYTSLNNMSGTTIKAITDVNGDGRDDVIAKELPSMKTVVGLTQANGQIDYFYWLNNFYDFVVASHIYGTGTSDLIFYESATGKYLIDGLESIFSTFRLRNNEVIIGSGRFLSTSPGQLLVFNSLTRQVYIASLARNTEDYLFNGASHIVNYYPILKLATNVELVNIGDYNGNGQDDFLVRNKQTKAINLVSFTGSKLSTQAIAKLPAGFDFGHSAGVRY